ncbi:MAG: sterol desaturase family protein [Flavobacteriales bacterium]|nr:sterol desaturase family protein [Flavobacteriales bacterium]MBK6945255.1 sterol desaturase family protein [Flavobacteriales bacterium]MBK7239606.1 sterol desaturase family protein [Flavobacteriales bacterium]MBK9535188.1 sterol desaturase family protein [Flavobacteriales bacterium]MBP9137836.1 sterol desaturase family protein [Flavobacteriales bacterium]
MAKKIDDSGRMFESPLMEALTKTHIAFPLTIFFGTGALALYWCIGPLGLGIIGSLSLFIVGGIFFTLVEYLVHRYFYHMGVDTARKARLQYLFHGVHHDHPRDKKRLAMPPLMSAFMAVLFVGIYRLLMGNYGYAFGGGFMTGYATYLLIHYAIHIYTPPKNILRIIWKHHNLHHFVGDTGAFGVSSPLWDHIFGTMPEDPLKKRKMQTNT